MGLMESIHNNMLHRMGFDSWSQSIVQKRNLIHYNRSGLLESKCSIRDCVWWSQSIVQQSNSINYNRLDAWSQNVVHENAFDGVNPYGSWLMESFIDEHSNIEHNWFGIMESVHSIAVQYVRKYLTMDSSYIWTVRVLLFSRV